MNYSIRPHTKVQEFVGKDLTQRHKGTKVRKKGILIEPKHFFCHYERHKVAGKYHFSYVKYQKAGIGGPVLLFSSVTFVSFVSFV